MKIIVGCLNSLSASRCSNHAVINVTIVCVIAADKQPVERQILICVSLNAVAAAAKQLLNWNADRHLNRTHGIRCHSVLLGRHSGQAAVGRSEVGRVASSNRRRRMRRMCGGIVMSNTSSVSGALSRIGSTYALNHYEYGAGGSNVSASVLRIKVTYRVLTGRHRHGCQPVTSLAGMRDVI